MKTNKLSCEKPAKMNLFQMSNVQTQWHLFSISVPSNATCLNIIILELLWYELSSEGGIDVEVNINGNF